MGWGGAREGTINLRKKMKLYGQKVGKFSRAQVFHTLFNKLFNVLSELATRQMYILLSSSVQYPGCDVTLVCIYI